ncbi:hypothetical protein [Cryptosporangium phraense]|uniref:Uncharacterized protein n=1 Tax=Cryptosporangium phraense TaxID=2593070 RepID=A0A545AXH6_9ACTN|nr:hypothetical protein [Cryptosporangium phraense]TQS46032.1 hypothetical protein FL583_05965 [Cryptosporangium phraense]
MAGPVLDVVVQGLTAPATAAEREAMASPPYPVPAAWAAPRDRLLRELGDRLPATGDGPPTVTRTLGAPRPFRDVVRSLGRPGPFRFADAACALLAAGALDDSDVDELVALLPGTCGIRRQQVLNRLTADDLEGALAAADRIPGDTGWAGHRDVAAVLADRGDAAGFFAGWKRYAAGQHRDGMAALKGRLVTGVARAQGWPEALAVTQDKRIGPGFASDAFSAFGADVEGLSQVLAGEAAGVLPEIDELSVLVPALVAASGRDPERDHPLLAPILDRIVAVDPTTDKATMRARDHLLFSLWPAIGEHPTLDRVRKAVRTPSLRRELTRLPREPC